MRNTVKRTVERFAVGSGLAHALTKRRVPSSTILAYHNVVPHGERALGDVSLHIDQRRFADHLDRVLESHDIVPLDQMLVYEERETSRPRVAITFDDAYAGTLIAGLSELRARSVPATVFVAPGLLDGEGCWWDMLAGTSGEPLAPRIRDHALWKLQGRQDRVLAWARDQGVPWESMPYLFRPATRSLLDEAARQSVLTFGSHTWSHPNLAALEEEECRMEICRAHDWVEGLGTHAVDWMAYPYGLCRDMAVRVASEHVGRALLVEGGSAQVRGKWRADPHRTPRVNAPRQLTRDGMSLRMAGLR